MNPIFQEYNRAVVHALDNLIKIDDLVTRKTENFLKILRAKKEIKTILHCGFGPVAIGLVDAGYDVSIIDCPYPAQGYATPALLEEKLPTFKEVDFNTRYDAVIALDEYFTFVKDEQEQRNLIGSMSDYTKDILIVTLSDYKNMSENTKDFSDPQGYKTKNGSDMFLEKNTRGRNSFTTKVYHINQDDQLTTFGPFERRMLFFKQLARQTEDSGAVGFDFQKNVMYKGMLKKNYEHIIAINFS